jgi:hypothetical protein
LAVLLVLLQPLTDSDENEPQGPSRQSGSSDPRVMAGQEELQER